MHKIEWLNVFIVCGHLVENHVPVFLICWVCDSVVEIYIDFIWGVLGCVAKTVGFQIEWIAVEVEGICIICYEGGGV